MGIDIDAREIASRFVRNWQDAWNGDGPAAVARLYTPESMLVGAALGLGRGEIERLLSALYAQAGSRSRSRSSKRGGRAIRFWR